MAGKAQITVALSALQDLQELRAYYERDGVPDIGERLVAEIIAGIERLGGHPLSGRMVPEFRVEHLREIIYPPFRIVYRYDKDKVRVVRIWRSERRLKLP